MSSYLIERRTFLRGACASLALPLLEIMSPALSYGVEKKGVGKNLRACVLFKGCGVNPSAWDITGGTEREFELSKLLLPLKAHQKDVTILSGINSSSKANGGHKQDSVAFMTGRGVQSKFKQVQSFDQVIAEAIGGKSPVKSLVLRGDPYYDRDDFSENYLSYDAVGEAIPTADDPEIIFNTLFRGFNNRAHREATSSVLDGVKESYRAVVRKASGADRQTLEQYLAAVREVEVEIEQFKGDGDRERQERIAGIKDFPASGNLGERIKAMLDLIAIAFWTNTTRVASLMMSHTESRSVYDFLGVNEELHYLSHFVRARKAVLPNFDKVNQWHVGQFGYFLDKLKSFREGEGTIFDQSVVLFGSGIKHSDYHSVNDLPLVISGGGGGQIALGRHVRYDNEPNSNLLLKIIQMMGVKADAYGESTRSIPGVSELANFQPKSVDDGSWGILKEENGQMEVKGLLKLSVSVENPNLYYLELSNRTVVEIRSDFGAINSSHLDRSVGSVVRLSGEWKEENGKKVVTKFKNLVVQE